MFTVCQCDRCGREDILEKGEVYVDFDDFTFFCHFCSFLYNYHLRYGVA